ncbi:hypothetical protein AWU65_07230 [Paenibacillus glucanolyticus]|uniref:DUF2513 domain-containing protein n=1 Tax=Paenibacillus glucanolyticus TaxID=59843 RepID=A0A163HYT5_9BACL|nr:DUF2513 domain-containing protein [Paenibacillus glucanolyticus]KZS45719.1 hypothetical protein AWU65_07230 [Paenibacillus glucanolyticus]
MKRNMDIVRDLLLLTESLGPEGEHPQKVPYKSSWIDGVDDIEFYYHVRILEEAGFISTYHLNREFDFDTNTAGPEKYYPVTLTWQGHEFLDSIRDNNSWEKVKNSLGKNLSTVPVAVLATVTTEMAKEWALKKLGLK